MEARKRRRHHGNKDTTNWITPLWSFLGNGSPVFHPRNDYPLKPWKKSVSGVDGIWWISTVCKFAKKKRKRRGVYLGRSSNLYRVFIAFREPRPEKEISWNRGIFAGKPIQSFKIGGHVHDPAFEILRMYPSFFLFVSQTSRLCNERWQMFHNLWLPYVHDIFYDYDGERWMKWC